MRSNGGERWRGFEKFKVKTAEVGKRATGPRFRTRQGQRAKIVVEPRKGVEVNREKQNVEKVAGAGTEHRRRRQGEGLVENILPRPAHI